MKQGISYGWAYRAEPREQRTKSDAATCTDAVSVRDGCTQCPRSETRDVCTQTPIRVLDDQWFVVSDRTKNVI